MSQSDEADERVDTNGNSNGQARRVALPYMQLYVTDYKSDTEHLTTVEHGAYLLLMMNYWQTARPLPASDKRLAAIAKLPLADWMEIRDTLAEFFETAGDVWRHKRIERDLARIIAKSEQAAAAGKASGEARRKQGKTNGRSNGRSPSVERIPNKPESEHESNATFRAESPTKQATAAGETSVETRGKQGKTNGRSLSVERITNESESESESDSNFIDSSLRSESHPAECREPGEGDGLLALGELPKVDPKEAKRRMVVDAWNGQAERSGLPPARWPLAKTRASLVDQRIAEYGIDQVIAELDSIPTRRRFLSDKPGHWRADLGQIMRASTFAALLEGRYDRPNPVIPTDERSGVRNPILRNHLADRDANVAPGSARGGRGGPLLTVHLPDERG